LGAFFPSFPFRMRKIILFVWLLAAFFTAQSILGAEDLSTYKTADALWTHVDDLKGSLSDAMRNGDSSAETLVPEMRAALTAFNTQYPKDARAWGAKLLLCQLNGIALKMKLPNIPSAEETTKQLEAIAADKTAPKDIRAQASFQIIVQMLPTRENPHTDLAALDDKISSFEKEYGDSSLDGRQPTILMLRQEEMMVFQMAGDEVKYRALVKKIVADPNPELAEYAKQEQGLLQKIDELKTKPMELKYTAVDGIKVDLSQMRGKVVLIDFWATWCGPCVAEMPKVIDAYKKFHSQGFEIVGISLDQDKGTLLAFTKKNGMTWPQYFDGQGFDNAISSGYDIHSIPTMWLIDKKGMLVNTQPSLDLDGAIQKLLQAP